MAKNSAVKNYSSNNPTRAQSSPEETDTRVKNPVVSIILKRRLPLCLSALLAIAGALSGLIPYLIIFFVATELFLAEHVDGQRLTVLSAWAAVAVVAKMTLRAGANALSHATAYRILADLRLALAHKLSTMPLGRVRARSSGHIKKVLQDDVEQLELGLSHAIPDIAAALAVPSASLIIMFIMSWQVGLAALSIIVIAIALIMWAVRRSIGVAKNESTVKSELNTSVISYLRGMKVIRGFLPRNTGFSAVEAAIGASERIENQKMSRGKWQAVASSAIVGSSVLFILPVGLWCVHEAVITPATLVFFLLVGTGFAQPLMGLMVSLAVLQYQVEAGLRNITEILQEPDLSTPENPQTGCGFSIACHNISFSYEGSEQPALENINLRIPEKGSLALVGPSGGGKSTLIGLLARFHDPTRGAITLGGVDLRDIDPAELMQHIAYVQQDDYIFADTLLENIRMARPNANDAEVHEAARRARVSDFVSELENGWDTVLTPGGGGLSGGQRQRISIARAMLKGSRIILLDEATAFLNPESEAAIANALGELRREATTVTVAHRLGSITDYDTIAYIERGRISAAGTHQELLEKHPPYTAMWESYRQAQGWRLEAQENPTTIPKPLAEAADTPLKHTAPGTDKTDRPEIIRVKGLKQLNPVRQWFALLGPSRKALWRRGIWWIILDGLLTSAPMIIVLFALLETLTRSVRSESWWQYGALLLGIFILRWLAGVALASTWWKTATGAIAHLQRSVLAHLRRIPLGEYDRLNTGRNATLVVSDIPLLDFINLPAKVIIGLFQPILAATVLFLLDWQLALAALAGVPVFLLLLWLSDRTQNTVVKEVTARRSQANSDLLELVSGTSVLRANPDAPQAERYRLAVERLRQASVAMAVRTSPVSSLASAILELGFAALIFMVCLRTLSGTLPGTTAILLLVISLSLYRPYQELMDLSSYRHLQGQITARMAEIWDIDPLVDGKTQHLNGTDVTADRVSFSYRDGHTVLHDASFRARAGEVTALVGPSGAGKSTVANLVARFWDVDSGSMRIGDHDVRELSADALEKSVTTVYQEVYLFPTTVRDNLCLGVAVPEAELEKALRAAQAWDFVRELPEGINTEISEGGLNLSGGQRQRLAIARALLKNAPVLLLDEAVASVDPQTEVRIQHALSSLVAGRTVIVVAHRLNTVLSAPQIIVLAHHGVEASGTHQTLVAQSPTYRRLWQANSKTTGL